ncbi:MAG: NlpC/P60 family protein [Bacillota bacterium]
MNKEISLKIVEEAEKAYQEGYSSPYSKGCADFVSTILERAGWKKEHVTWVPRFFEYGFVTKKPTVGDLVVFRGTYDAVLPTGIGPEDDKTHVGILINNNGDFIHYGSGRVKKSNINTHYWREHFEVGLIIVSGWPTAEDKFDVENNYKTYKIFYHPKANRPTLVRPNEDDLELMETFLTAVAPEGTEVRFNSHPFENNPNLVVEDKSYEVVSIEARIKVRSE